MRNKQEDFVYMSIYRGALKVGAFERLAKDHAVMGLEDYKRGRFDKVINLINKRIQDAKKDSKYEPPAIDQQRTNTPSGFARR